jgi:tetratricopeptide (TPR) repeat protein
LPKPSLLLALAFTVAAGLSPADISRVRDFGYRQQYDSAFAITSAAIARDSADPAGYCWQAAILQLLINDSGRGALADSFHALSDRAVALSKKRLARDPDDAQAHLYYGITQMNRASFLGWQQQPLSAFRASLGVASHLNAALARDSSLDEARLGLGMLDFLMAMSSRYTLGLRIVGSRKRAYAVVKPLADGNGPVKSAAQQAMAYMLKQDGDYNASLGYCRQLLATYPGNRTTLRLMRDALFEAGRLAEAVRVGAELDIVIPRAFTDNKYCIAENWIVCAKAYAQMGQKEEARQRFVRIIAWEPYQADVPWLAHYVRESKQWLKKL